MYTENEMSTQETQAAREMVDRKGKEEHYELKAQAVRHTPHFIDQIPKPRDVISSAQGHIAKQ